MVSGKQCGVMIVFSQAGQMSTIQGLQTMFLAAGAITRQSDGKGNNAFPLECFPHADRFDSPN